MKPVTLPYHLEGLLMKSHFAYLCTVSTAGQPHVTPIFFTFNPADLSIYFLTSSKSKKLVNLRSNPKVSLTIDTRDPVDPLSNYGVLISGIADIIGPLTSAAERAKVEWEKRLYGAFKEKYPTFETWLTEAMAKAKPAPWVWVKIKPSKMTWWRGPRFESIL